MGFRASRGVWILVGAVHALSGAVLSSSQSSALAGDPVDSGVTVSNAYVDVMFLMREARDPARTRAEKSAAAQRGLNFIRAQVGSQLPIKNVDELPAYFAAHPELNDQLSLNSTQGLGRLVTEFNLLLQDIRAQEKLKDCDGGRRSFGIQRGMAGHDPCQGNRVIHSNFYQEVGRNGDVVQYGAPVPSFVSGNVAEILATSSLTHFFDEKNDGKNPFRPTLEQAKNASPSGAQDGELGNVALYAELRGQAYKQAIAREVRNRVSLVYQYQKTPGNKSWDEVKTLIGSAVKQDCRHCTPEMTREIERNVQGMMVSDINHKILGKREDPAAIGDQLCSKIKSLGFPFRGGKEEKQIRDRFDATRRGMIGAPSYATAGLNLQEDTEIGALADKRKEILGKLVEEGGDGLLFLTGGLSTLDGPIPVDTKLKCSNRSKAEDSAIVSVAANEAIQKTRDFAGILNNTIHPGKLDLESQRAELDQLVKLAPGAVGEALNYSHPAAASLVCGSLSRLQNEDNLQDLKDGAVMWGSMIVGVVSVIATRGASLPIVMAGAGASAAAGVGAAIYSWDESGEAAALANLYREAAIAQGGDPNLLGMSQDEFLRFKEHRFNAVLSGAFSALEIANLVAAGAKAGKNMAEINAEIERIAANPAEKGNWFKQGAKTLAKDALINTAISSAANGYIMGDFTPDPTQVAMGMLIGASVRRLGKPIPSDEVGLMKTDLEQIQKDFKKAFGRTPNPDELMAAYETSHFKEAEVIAEREPSKPSENRVRAPTPKEDGTLLGVTDQNRSSVASTVLGRELPANQGKALQDAHEVGRGEIGKDGTPAGKGNYTQAQIRKKAEILKSAGYTDAEIRSLMEKGLAGDERGGVSFGDFDAASGFQPGRAISVRRSGGSGYTNAVISKVKPDGTYVVEWYEGGQHLQKDGVSASMLGDYMPVESGHIALGQGVSVPTAAGVSNGRVLEMLPNGRIKVEVTQNGRVSVLEVPTSQVMDPLPESAFSKPAEKPSGKPDEKKLSLVDRMKKLLGGSSKPVEAPKPVESPRVQPSDPNQRDWYSKKGDDYVSRGGALVKVDYDSPALNRVVNDAVATIEQVTGIKAGGDAPLTDAQRKQIYEAWLKHVVPKIEDPNKTSGIYGDSRDRIIARGGNQADLGVILESQAAVCRELSLAGSVVFGEFGIATTVQAGNVGTVSGRGGGHAWIRDDLGNIIDNNYTRDIHTWDDYQNRVGGAEYSNQVQPVKFH